MPAQVVRLTDAATGATADVLVSLGFNCFSWVTPLDGAPRELLWAEPGFADGDKRPSSSGIPLLAPFPGRIRGGVYEWNGKRYELPAGDGRGNAIHGFAFDNAWRVTDQSAERVEAEFQASVDAPEVADLWPGDLKYTAAYRVGSGELDFEFEATNLGDEPAPFGFGTHAYFRLPLAEGTDPESTIVQAAVDGEWATEGLIPTGECEAFDEDHDLPAGALLAGREFDTPFRFAPGGGVTELVDAPSGHAVTQAYDDSMRCCVIYTPPHREAICLEPYTCVPNAIELEAAGVNAGLLVIEPGASYRTRIKLAAVDASVAAAQA